MLAEELGALIVEPRFEEVVHLAAELPLADREAFESRVLGLSAGAVRPRLVSTRLARFPV